MYEYKYVKIKAKVWTNHPKEDYHLIVDENIKKGWRFIQIFAPSTRGHGTPGFYELIFERKKI